VSKRPPKPSRLAEFMIRLGLASRVGSHAAQFLIARWLTKPTRARIRQTPSQLGLDWSDLTCLTEDGHRLHGWVVAPPVPAATLLLFHGSRLNREKMLSRLAFLVPAGYRCVAFDHRAHGESEGKLSSFGYHERFDVLAVLDLARQSWPHQPFAMLGMSMGAAAICFAADAVARHVRAVILESLYHDILSAFSNRLQSGHYPPYFERLTQGVIRHCERRIGEDAHVLTPAEWIAKLAPAPILLLTGANDDHATPAEAELLFARRRGPGELFLVPRAGHQDVCETGGPLYRQRVLAFLERSLSSTDGRVA
jgi:uncharacterized protein